MDAELDALRAGDITFDVFARRVRGDCRALAIYLFRRWSLPCAVSVEDIEQEILFAMWELLPKFDPSRGRTLKDFVVYIACERAKRFIHRQRASLRRRDTSPSRFPLVVATFGESDEDAVTVDHLARVAPSQEKVTLAKQNMADVLARANTRDRACIVAVVAEQGDVTAATDRLYDDVATRRRCRFGCRADARRAIWRAARAVQ